jgi:hypothetical protein
MHRTMKLHSSHSSTQAQRWGSGVLLVLLAIVTLGMVFASTTNAQTGADEPNSVISQGYESDKPFTPGTLVSYVDGDLVASSTQNSRKLLGIVSGNGLIELNTGQVQVATVGIATAYVSTISGELKQGDPIAPSPLEGIGMKAETNGYIVGIAQDDFSTATNIYTTEVRDKNGNKVSVRVGLLPVRIQVSDYSVSNEVVSPYPDFIMNIATTVAGKEVPVLRVTLALLALLVGMVIIGLLIYTSVRFSLVSIGRNPLAAHSVHKGLIGVIILAIAVLAFTILGLYLILVL